MNTGVLLIVLFAALLHALWNAIVKGADDKAAVLGLIALGHVVPGVLMVAVSEAPSFAAIPYIIASTIIHWGYYALLNIAYKFGDLSIVYPIARGVAPVLIAIGAYFWVGEVLPNTALIGIVVISVGIMTLTYRVSHSSIPAIGIVAAVGTAITIAAYSLVDGVGVRLSGSVMGYVGWLFIAEIIVAAYVFSVFWSRVRVMPRKTIWIGILGGMVSGSAYGLVLYAKTLAPLGIVSALRETSVIFAALIGVLWFSEGPRGKRIVAAIIVAIGVVFIASSKGT